MLTIERFVATRYFKKKSKKSFISFVTWFAIGGIAIGSAALIITLSIVNGFSNEIEKKLVAFGSHISINTFSGTSFSYPHPRMQELDTVSFIHKISPVFAKEGIIRAGRKVEGVMINGVIATQMVIDIPGYVTEGRFFTDSDTIKHPVVIGKKLSQLLSIGLHDRVTFFGITGAPTPGDSPNIIQGSIVGIYDTGMQGFDDLFVYLPLPSVQELYLKYGEITTIQMKTNDLKQADDYADYLQNLLPWPFNVRSIYQTQANLFNWIALQQQMIPIVVAVLILVAIVNVVGTLLMIVVDKIPEIGVLRSLGANRDQITRIFMVEGVIILLIGLLIGNFIGVGFCVVQSEFQLMKLPAENYFMHHVPILFQWSDWVLVNSLTTMLALVSAYIPSVVAGRIQTVSALRFQ